ncbi:MAG: YfiR/HmsC family protein [Candidatus Kapaibacterium sp.]
MIAFMAMLCGMLTHSIAQETAISVSSHVPILCKVLSFDRNLKQQSRGVITIGVVYQSKFRVSLNTVNDLQRYFTENPVKISGQQVVLKLIDISEDNLNTVLNSDNFTVLYIAPLRAYNVANLHLVCSSKKIRTITGVPEYVEAGISVGVGTKGNQAEIIINRTSSISEGADFSAQLLKLARIIEEK